MRSLIQLKRRNELDNLVTGNELTEKHGLKDIDLFHLVQRGDLMPRDWIGGAISRPDCRTDEYLHGLKLKRDLLENELIKLSNEPNDFLSGYRVGGILGDKSSFLHEIKKIDEELARYKDRRRDPYDWKNYRLPTDKIEASVVLKLICEATYRKDEIEKTNGGEGIKRKNVSKNIVIDNSGRNNLLPSQRHKQTTRDVAEKLWKEDPSITIAGMAHRDEINALHEGKTYAEKTIRKWIKDLCPNRSPGRRPNA
jgi:hypothetical protein